MDPTSSAKNYLDLCFSTAFGTHCLKKPPDDGSMDTLSFIAFFDSCPLPFPMQLTFNSHESDMCKTFGDILRKYYSLGYRHGALDHFLDICKVTQISPEKYMISGLEEHVAKQPPTEP